MKHLFKFGAFCLFCFLIFATACDSPIQSRNCGRFRNGLFRYHSDRTSRGDVLIERNDSIQIETYVESGFTSKFSVKWTGPCNYELRMLETTHQYPDSIQQLRMNTTLYVEILGSDKNYYYYGISDKKGEIEVKDTLWLERGRRNNE